ncbi:MAG TPA: ferric iron reductase [Bdellovibrio sp.]
MMTLILRIFLGLTFIAQNAVALTPAAKTLIDHETKANAVALRSNEVIDIPHFNIPLELVDTDFAARFSEDFRKHLIFERHGKKYIRWILNPEDTKWGEEVAVYFVKEHNIKLERKFYFKGYKTASRSYIVEDPQKQIQFSVKSSTNKTGGHWADKKQPVGEAIDSRLNADILHEIQQKLPFEHAIVMDEPAILKLPAIDQAVVIRDLSGINDAKSGMIYLPGFAVLHETAGALIAKANGSNNPYSFWTTYYVKAVARAMGEFGARTGMQFDSPHSQNFLVEFDSNYRPTGRIVLRDLADFYVDKRIMRAVHSNPTFYFEKFTQTENVKTSTFAAFGPLHGNNPPSWVSAPQYVEWKDIYFKEFEKTFSRVSGLPVESFKTREGEMNGRYFSNAYTLKAEDTAVDKYLNNLGRYQSPQGILYCPLVLAL